MDFTLATNKHSNHQRKEEMGDNHPLNITSISIVPLEILVPMCRAWKNEVFSGPSPVLPGGTNTSIGAKAPAFAGAPTFKRGITNNQGLLQDNSTMGGGYQKEGSIVPSHHTVSER